ncbi:ABC transporter substrate-binding protein [Limimaricola hongkongensis]|uniref:Branched-chain amino acid ABC transporter, amino acid-binding protein n=1 Tax=Limimaricola hongkongensis DSM 17492 TaxID=1122180 RepID=A0A017HBX2_9RHOB|nr:ABC transporter substrate-binding protein [Limimaricola hongkongensis]EYD71876.1 Branched-chain amino acid ABC transporter, amino acid-binding protein [Limimaricola hongkongensis DSM 17492]
MKKLLLASAATALVAGTAMAESHSGPVKIGIILGFTGPLESITPDMAGGAELAINEVNETGAFMGGTTIEAVRADSTCIDSAAATAAAERLVTNDGVAGIMGADCSGVTGAILQNVARANGVVMISPSATSPALSEAEDDGMFFRTAPSDARQGEIMSQVIMDRGISEVALTYTNNDYGKGLADSFQKAFEADGGSVTITAAHEDGKADYSAEVASLASAGGEVLVVAGYTDQGGKGIIQASLDSGAFDTFVLPDGMIGQQIVDDLGSGLDGSFGQLPGSDSEGTAIFQEMATGAGINPTGIYTGESYDAAALMILAMAKAGSTSASDYAGEIMDIANAPGEQILPGELGRALELIEAGEEIDYVGATAVEFIEPGESAGTFKEIEIKDGAIETVGFR